jgi:hypothetical protein
MARHRSILSAVRAVLVFLTLLAPATSAGAEPGASRAFRMGFTGFPHDFTAEAINESREFCRANGDIIAHHIEGVPWAESLWGRPFSPELMQEWEGKTRATPRGGKVYLAISPGRGDLKVAEKALALPPELAGKPYDDPAVMRAYLAYCRRAVDFFKPDYLAIGIEVNEIFQAGADKWRAYAVLHRHVYAALKRDHRNLPIFASFSLHGMLNARGRQRERMTDALREIMPASDLVAVSFYPFIRGGTTDIAGCFTWLTDNFDQYEKPYAIVETGEAAERFRLPQSGQIIDGAPQKQERYAKALLEFASSHRTAFVIWFIHRDYDALWQKIAQTARGMFATWRDCGLLDGDGKPRPAYAHWKRTFARPLNRRKFRWLTS